MNSPLSENEESLKAASLGSGDLRPESGESLNPDGNHISNGATANGTSNGSIKNTSAASTSTTSNSVSEAHVNGITSSPSARVVEQAQPKSKKLLKRGLQIFVAAIIVAGLTIAVILTWFPNIAVHYYMEPKLKQWVHDKLGKSYSLDFAGITLSSNRDSLIVTGVRLADTSGVLNAKSGAIDHMLIDTITVAGIDYSKLLLANGLFSGSITIHSPKIFLRPGTFPKFASTESVMPQFLPVLSTKKILIENAQIFVTEGPDPNAPELTGVSPTPSGTSATSLPGLSVMNASLELRDFYVDQPSIFAPKRPRTFFSSSASFTANGIAHVNRNGITDLAATSATGNLVDSTMTIVTARVEDPTKSVRRASVQQIDIAGLDWNRFLERRGLRADRTTITAPEVYLQDNASLPEMDMTSNVPLPKLVPSVDIGTVAVSNATVLNILPGSRRINSLKRVSLVLHDLAMDSTSLLSGISSLFSRDVNFAISGTTTLASNAGSASFGNVHGDLKSVQASSLDLHPKMEGVKRIALKSLTANGIDWTKLLMRKGLFAGSVILRSPKVALDEAYTGSSDPDGATGKKGPLPTAVSKLFGKLVDAKESPLPDVVPIVAAGTISVTDGTLTGVRFFDGTAAPPDLQPALTGSRVTGDSIHGLKINLKNFRLDRKSFIANRGMLFSKQGTFSFVGFDHTTTDQMYHLSEASGRGNLSQKTLSVDSVVLRPLLDEDAFSTIAKSNTERITFYGPQLVIAGFDLQKLLTGKGIFADSIFAANWKLDLYADKRLPDDTRTTPAIYPNEAFQHITTLLGVRTILTKSGDFTFRDRYPTGTEPGRITLNDINATIGPVSNDPTVVPPDEPTKVTGSLNVMDAGHFDFELSYSLMSPHLDLSMHGKLDSMNASLFNDYLIHAEPFKLTGGIVEGTEISLNAKDSTLHVLALPLYDNLRVEFFQSYILTAGLASFFGNLLFIRGHNTFEKDHPPHSGELTTTMDRADSFWWSLWLPMRESIDQVLGIPDKVW